jgi:hypothetical protein
MENTPLLTHKLVKTDVKNFKTQFEDNTDLLIFNITFYYGNNDITLECPVFPTEGDVLKRVKRFITSKTPHIIDLLKEYFENGVPMEDYVSDNIDKTEEGILTEEELEDEYTEIVEGNIKYLEWEVELIEE